MIGRDVGMSVGGRGRWGSGRHGTGKGFRTEILGARSRLRIFPHGKNFDLTRYAACIQQSGKKLPKLR
jgi:hypothetical protein